MEIHVLGVGEASDPAYPNASVLVAQDGWRLLIDCGHSVPPVLWRSLPDPDGVDAIYFTHHHPDHCFGLVPVLIRWKDDRRRKPLDIVTTDDGRARLELVLKAGGIAPRRNLGFDLRWRDTAAVDRLGPFAARFASTRHSLPNEAIRLEADGRSFCYSGDGRPTPEAEALYRGADLLFHECYVLDPDPEMRFHAELPTVADLARRAGVGSVRLYHIRADQRAGVAEGARRAGLGLAEPGETIRL